MLSSCRVVVELLSGGAGSQGGSVGGAGSQLLSGGGCGCCLGHQPAVALQKILRFKVFADGPWSFRPRHPYKSALLKSTTFHPPSTSTCHQSQIVRASTIRPDAIPPRCVGELFCVCTVCGRPGEFSEPQKILREGLQLFNLAAKFEH
jgi:hypothetical protein